MNEIPARVKARRLKADVYLLSGPSGRADQGNPSQECPAACVLVDFGSSDVDNQDQLVYICSKLSPVSNKSPVGGLSLIAIRTGQVWRVLVDSTVKEP